MRIGQSKNVTFMTLVAPACTAGLAGLCRRQQGQRPPRVNRAGGDDWVERPMARTHRKARVQEPARRSTQLDVSVAPMPSSPQCWSEPSPVEFQPRLRA
jgi:hypothetical protein